MLSFVKTLMPNVTQIAGGPLVPGEKASWQLCRLVQSFDSASKMNITGMHLFVERGSHYDTNEILKKLRMFAMSMGLVS